MADTGKISREFFAEYIAPRLGASRDDVRVGPKHGVDFGVIDTDEQALVIASDPISILPGLGFERAGRFAIRFVLADVAVSGLAPTHLAVSFSLPPEMTDAEFAGVWDGIHRECQELGVAVVTGHTARYSGCSFPWVGAGTAIALGPSDRILRPDGAQPGDSLIITNGPAVETTGLLTSLFPDRIDLPESTLATAQERLSDTGVVRDAQLAAAAGARAMHDATEGGLLGALFEMAASAGVRLEITAHDVPMLPGVRETCETLGIDPWKATTGGTLVIAAPPNCATAIVSALEAEGTPAAVVGRVETGSGVDVDGDAKTRPTKDASWAAYERLSREG